LQFVKSCDMLTVVLPAPRQAVPPTFFGGDNLLLPPIEREGVTVNGYMGRNFSILHGHYSCHCPGSPG